MVIDTRLAILVDQVPTKYRACKRKSLRTAAGISKHVLVDVAMVRRTLLAMLMHARLPGTIEVRALQRHPASGLGNFRANIPAEQ